MTWEQEIGMWIVAFSGIALVIGWLWARATARRDWIEADRHAEVVKAVSGPDSSPPPTDTADGCSGRAPVSKHSYRDELRDRNAFQVGYHSRDDEVAKLRAELRDLKPSEEHTDCHHDHCDSKYDCALCERSLQEENRKLKREVGLLDQALGDEVTETSRLRAELAKPRVKFRAAMCLWCGKAIPHGDGKDDEETLDAIRRMQAHDFECEKNPITRKLKECRVELAGIREERTQEMFRAERAEDELRQAVEAVERWSARATKAESLLSNRKRWLERTREELRDLKASLREDEEDAPRVVCLCGSTRFYEAFQRANYDETMAGNIVLSVGFCHHCATNVHGEGYGCTPDEKIELDELHLRKIDLADEVLILNVGGSIGESTGKELAYARAQGKRVRFLEQPDSGESPAEEPFDLDAMVAAHRKAMACNDVLDFAAEHHNLLKGVGVRVNFQSSREAREDAAAIGYGEAVPAETPPHEEPAHDAPFGGGPVKCREAARKGVRDE